MPKNSFEENFRRLEEIVQTLEHGDLPLEEAISHFEEGMKVVKQCEELLTSARLRVEQLIAESGGGYRIEEWRVEEQGSGGAGEQGSGGSPLGAGERGSRGAGEQGSRGAGERGSRGAGEQR